MNYFRQHFLAGLHSRVQQPAQVHHVLWLQRLHSLHAAHRRRVCQLQVGEGKMKSFLNLRGSPFLKIFSSEKRL